jgi:hypothetical protein
VLPFSYLKTKRLQDTFFYQFSAGNISRCRGHYVARVLRIERAIVKAIPKFQNISAFFLTVTTSMQVPVWSQDCPFTEALRHEDVRKSVGQVHEVLSSALGIASRSGRFTSVGRIPLDIKLSKPQQPESCEGENETFVSRSGSPPFAHFCLISAAIRT